MKPIFDLSLYLVTDHNCLRGRDFLDCIDAALRGGVTLVQLREKDTGGKLFLARAVAVKALCDKYKVPLLINDRIDIAMAIGAAGVHLGQEDIPLETARRLLGAEAIIGISAHNHEEVRLAEQGGADYLGMGAIFPTGSKTDAAEIGLEGLRELKKATRLPVVGIGGIKAENYASVRAAGAEGAAIISGILGADDIEDEIKKLKKTISA